MMENLIPEMHSRCSRNMAKLSSETRSGRNYTILVLKLRRTNFCPLTLSTA
jgi:hypothetical protein